MRPPTRPAVHLVVWVAVYLFWLVVTRNNQPTWAVAVVATAILVGASAVAVYTDWYGLRPRFLAKRMWLPYLLGLGVVIAGLSFVTVPMIQAVYDAAGIPAEGRFGYWENVGLEAVWYAVHVAVAAGLRVLVNRRKGTAVDEQSN